MRLMFVIGAFSFGGAERVICNLANRFQRDGHQVTIVCFSKRDRTYFVEPGVSVINGIMDSRQLNAIRRLRGIVKQERPNLVLSFLTHINIAVIVACFGLGVPVVVSERNDPRSIPPELSRRLLRKLFYPFASGHVFQTHDAQSFFSRRIQSKSSVIPNPLFVSMSPSPFTERKRQIVSVARLVPQKRQEMILRAFAEARVANDGYTLHFYGEDEDNRVVALMQISQTLGVDKAVFFHGECSNLHEEIRQAQIFVLASDYEGMPNALMEAMALGLACVSTDCPCGGPRFLIEDGVNGLLIPTGNQRALAEKLNILCSDAVLRERISARAVDIRDKLDGERIYKQWLDYLSGVCGDSMRVLMLNTYFDPEGVSDRYLNVSLSDAFASDGIDVTVITPIPSRNVSKAIRKRYSTKDYRIEHGEKKTIMRFWAPVEPHNMLLRALRYLYTDFRLLVAGIMIKADAVIVDTTPPTHPLIGLFIQKVRHSACIYYLQDLFPDNMICAGKIKQNSLIANIGIELQKFIITHAKLVLTVSEDMRKRAIELGCDPQKAKLAYLWSDTERISSVPKESNTLFSKFGLSRDKFLIVYAGNLGYMQNVRILIDAAYELRKIEDIYFIIIGDGTQKEVYVEYARKKGTHNVSFFSLQPYELVDQVYSLGDLSVVICASSGGNGAMPSKFCQILSAGTPVIAIFDKSSELSDIIREYNAGYTAQPDNVFEITQTILDAYNNRNNLKLLGENARKCAEEKFSTKVCTKHIIELVRDTAEHRCIMNRKSSTSRNA